MKSAGIFIDVSTHFWEGAPVSTPLKFLGKKSWKMDNPKA